MPASITQAKQWLYALREQHQRDSASSTQVQVLIEAHAYYCACRDLTERKIMGILLNSVKERWEQNRSPEARPDSLKLILHDPDESQPKHRRTIELIVLFELGNLPRIISAWRSGSPRLANGDPCPLNPASPLCKQQNRKPRGRIG